MEELLELKQLLLRGDIKGSLAIVDELEEMSRSAIIDKIESYAIILLMHLIKQEAEHRTTKSWDVSIRNSVSKIIRINKRRKAKDTYLSSEELREVFEEAYASALNSASLEVAEGIYEVRELVEMVNRETIIERALTLIGEKL
jgi:hypothetical protein